MPRLVNKKGSSSYGRSGPSWHISNVVKVFDNFAGDIPAFNLKGETKVKTMIGGCATLAIIVLVLAYATMKLIHLVERRNPQITQHTTLAALDVEKTVNMKEIGFRMAFTMENYLTKETIDDPRYVKWIVRMYGRNNGEWYEDILPYHKCTDEDYSQFSPLDDLSAPGFEKMR